MLEAPAGAVLEPTTGTVLELAGNMLLELEMGRTVELATETALELVPDGVELDDKSDNDEDESPIVFVTEVPVVAITTEWSG